MPDLIARPPLTAKPVRILRIGDSITRMASTDPTLARRLNEAGVEHVFVGGQHPRGGPADLNTACDGYDGKPIEFFLTQQASYGQEQVFTDALPLQRALQTERPDLILAMLGVNNLGNTSAAEIDVTKLTGLLREFIDRTEEWMPKGALILVATVPPANDANGKDGPALNRNLRHTLYNDRVVRPLIAELAAAGRPVRLVDHHAALTPADNYDVVHQNETGRTKINTVWADAVLATLAVAAKAW